MEEAKMHIQRLHHRTYSALGWRLIREMYFITRQSLRPVTVAERSKA
jgi:hypothetical protein